MNGNKLLWWLMGLIGSALIVLGMAFNAALNNIEIMVVDIRLKVNTLEGQMRTVEAESNATRNEQIERTAKFGALENKLSLIEYTHKVLDERVTDMVRQYHLTVKGDAR